MLIDISDDPGFVEFGERVARALGDIGGGTLQLRGTAHQGEWILMSWNNFDSDQWVSKTVSQLF